MHFLLSQLLLWQRLRNWNRVRRAERKGRMDVRPSNCIWKLQSGKNNLINVWLQTGEEQRWAHWSNRTKSSPHLNQLGENYNFYFDSHHVVWLFFIASDFWWLCPKIWFQKAFLCRWYFCTTCSQFYTITVSRRTQTTNSSQHWNPHASYDVDTTSVEKQQVHSFLDCTFPSSAFDPMLVLSKKSQAANLVLCRYHKHIHHNVFYLLYSST